MFLKKVMIVALAALSMTTEVYAATVGEVTQVAKLVQEPIACVRVLVPGRQIEFSIQNRLYHVIYDKKGNGLVVASGVGGNSMSVSYDVGLSGVNDHPENQAAYDADVQRILKGPIDCIVPSA